MKKHAAALALLALPLAACTAVQVNPVSASNGMQHVCIQQNPRVRVSGFVAVVREGFGKHGITTRMVPPGPLPPECEYSAAYTALTTWDMTRYLSVAQVDIFRNGHPIASAKYHLRGKGGLSPAKWDSTRSKMLPVMDELLAQYNAPPLPEGTYADDDIADTLPAPQLAAEPAASAPPAPEPVASASSADITARLKTLKDAYEQKLITQEEYDAKRKALVDGL